MRRLLDMLGRRRWPLFLLGSVATMIPLVAVSSDGGGGPLWLIMAVALTLTAFVLTLGLNLAGHDPDAEERAAVLVSDGASQELLARWLRRSKYFRFVGGTVGCVLGIGFLDGSLLTLLCWILAGVAVGGGLAEIHVVRRRSGARRSAELLVRRTADYVSHTDLLALIVVGGLAIIFTVASVRSSADGRTVAMVSSIGATVAVSAAAGLQRSVVLRHRPALPPDLRSADDLLRRLAATQGFTRPSIALGVALLARALSELGTGTGYGAGAAVLWVAALAWYVSSRQSRSNLLSAVRP